MTFIRNVLDGHYVRFPKGQFTDIKKISTVLYSPARDSNAWLENIAACNRQCDMYVYNNHGEYCYSYSKPLTFREMCQYTLGGL